MSELIVALKDAVAARRAAYAELDSIHWEDHGLRCSQLAKVNELQNKERKARQELDAYIEEMCK